MKCRALEGAPIVHTTHGPAVEADDPQGRSPDSWSVCLVGATTAHEPWSELLRADSMGVT